MTSLRSFLALGSLLSFATHAKDCPSNVLVIDDGFSPTSKLEKSLSRGLVSSPEEIGREDEERRELARLYKKASTPEQKQMILNSGLHGHVVIQELSQGLSKRDVLLRTAETSSALALVKDRLGDPDQLGAYQQRMAKLSPEARKAQFEEGLRNFIKDLSGKIDSSKPRAHFVNLSFSPILTGTTDAERREQQQAMAKAFSKFYHHYADMVFVAAAGNEGRDTAKTLSSQYGWSGINAPNLFVVGSLDTQGKVSGFSNYGHDVPYYAKGEGVKISDGAYALNPISGLFGKKFRTEGTSFSAPRLLNLMLKERGSSCQSQLPPMGAAWRLARRLQNEPQRTRDFVKERPSANQNH